MAQVSETDSDETARPAAAGPGPVNELVDLAPSMSFRAAVTRFWPFIRPYPVQLMFIVLSLLATSALSTATTWLFKVMIDEVVVPGNLRAFWLIAGGFAVLALAQGLVSFAEHYLTIWTAERFSMRLRSRLFKHVLDLTPDFLERRSLGDTAARLNNDVDVIESLFTQIFLAIDHVILVCFFGVALFALDWQLALAALIATPSIALISRRFTTRVRAASRERVRRTGTVGGITEETLVNVALIRAYGRAPSEYAKFVDQNRASFVAHMASTRIQALFVPLTGLIQLAGTLAVFGLAVWEISHGRITIGGLLAFVTYLGRMTGPLQDFGSLLNSMFSANASAERVSEILDQRPSVMDSPHPRPLRTARGAICWESVTFSYPDTARPTLSEISFTILPGERLAVVGASGAGKTTIAKLMLRFYDPAEGRITLDGIDLRDVALADLYRNVSVVLQDTLLFDASIKENILWGRNDATTTEMEEAARAADADQFIRDLPEGYDTRVGQRGMLLSGGQRQRIALARALIRDAPILILDEPTSGLDAGTTRRVQENVGRVADSKTILIISHNLLTVTDVDRILFLTEGRITAVGPHENLMASCPEYAMLYNLHQHPVSATD